MEEVEALKTQMHIFEVDLNYTQYHPLSETYISLYPQKSSSPDESDSSDKAKPKPPMWAVVEEAMEEGTLSQLRNRVSNAPVTKPKTIKKKPAKPAKLKVLATPVDMTGLNRRQRRGQHVTNGTLGRKVKTKNQSMGFAKNQAFGAAQNAQSLGVVVQQDDDSDGGFFED